MYLKSVFCGLPSFGVPRRTAFLNPGSPLKAELLDVSWAALRLPTSSGLARSAGLSVSLPYTPRSLGVILPTAPDQASSEMFASFSSQRRPEQRALSTPLEPPTGSVATDNARVPACPRTHVEGSSPMDLLAKVSLLTSRLRVMEDLVAGGGGVHLPVSAATSPRGINTHPHGSAFPAGGTTPDGANPSTAPVLEPDAPRAPTADTSVGRSAATEPSSGHCALLDRIVSLEGRWEEAVAARSGLSALRAIVARDTHVLGRALATCAVSRLLDKVHTRPARGRVQQVHVGRAGLLTVDIDCTRKAMEELIDMNKLVSVVTRRKMGGPVCCTVQPSDLAALAAAVCMTPSDLSAVKMCRFSSRAGTVVTRLLLEEVRDESGKVWYILERYPLERELLVAVRESDQLGERDADFLHPLEKKRVKVDDVIGVSERYPASLVWREGRQRVGGSAGSDTEAGKLVMSVPAALLQCEALDAAALIE